MHCPSCRADDTKVVDSRLAHDGNAVRRRRQCLACAYRFTTFERAEETPLTVVKSSGVAEPFDRDKIIHGVASACKGRAVADEAIEQLATSVEDELRLVGGEITSSRIGLAVLDRLRLLDEVAYLRFASVYKNFDAAADFQSELELLSKLGGESPGG
ncbi:MAG: transcriptional regulator NrdR [Ilumatobacter sp.]|uniref:transcriptional regulator NrdR n=1 Tax=Ilumatobacter sp. TaxID=1967498 RepID=UPI0026105A9F|nr:transcriptional regulator NrdR [Ilumatobacter sp.]MDJ0769829.1 transcriptional regulator NrdR [Ilumatobacter sp.]